jgi:hypothetical protein
MAEFYQPFVVGKAAYGLLFAAESLKVGQRRYQLSVLDDF